MHVSLSEALIVKAYKKVLWLTKTDLNIDSARKLLQSQVGDGVEMNEFTVYV